MASKQASRKPKHARTRSRLPNARPSQWLLTTLRKEKEVLALFIIKPSIILSLRPNDGRRAPRPFQGNNTVLFGIIFALFHHGLPALQPAAVQYGALGFRLCARLSRLGVLGVLLGLALLLLLLLLLRGGEGPECVPVNVFLLVLVPFALVGELLARRDRDNDFIEDDTCVFHNPVLVVSVFNN